MDSPPPFLSKCYDMVDDSATDHIVSWSSISNGNSFVIWDTPLFSQELLPKYFKHNNFSSFVRQLNTYGFRKVDSDRWEFANDGFVKNQKHLLKIITRRKTNQGLKQAQEKAVSTVIPCVEVGKFGLKEEVEQLKRDKNTLMQELVKLRQNQQTSDNQLQNLRKRVQGMELHQQQMLSFMAMAMQRPDFFAQMVQQNDGNRRGSESSKKREFPSLENDLLYDDDDDDACDGQIVTYVPCTTESSRPLLLPNSGGEIEKNTDRVMPNHKQNEKIASSTGDNDMFSLPDICTDYIEQLLLSSPLTGDIDSCTMDEEDTEMTFELEENRISSNSSWNLDVLPERNPIECDKEK